MKVSVKTLEDRTITLEVDPDCTVEKFKSKISEMNGIPEDQQRIIFSGKHLQDGKTLAENKIKDGSVVHLVVRTLGGLIAINLLTL